MNIIYSYIYVPTYMNVLNQEFEYDNVKDEGEF